MAGMTEKRGVTGAQSGLCVLFLHHHGDGALGGALRDNLDIDSGG